MITTIISLASILCNIGFGIAFFRVWKNQQRQTQALKDYFDREDDFVSSQIKAGKRMIDQSSTLTADTLEKFNSRIKDLEEGIIPDYEKQKAATKAMNDFNDGISNVLGYDPFEALRAKKVAHE